MAILRSIPRKGRHASHRGRYMVDAVRGVLRVRKWPKKRGTPKSASQRFWIDWFTQANYLAKYADPMSQIRAIDMAKGSGMYPRDVLLKAMRGRLYTWVDQTGWKWYSVAAISDISESLDILAQTVGSVLVRAVDRWRTPDPGNVGDLLTYNGPDNPPAWAPPTGAGGVNISVLPGTPIVPDNTVNQYIFPVVDYAEVYIDLHEISFAAGDGTYFRFSTDGGVTYKSGATDYRRTFLSSGAQVVAWDSTFRLSRSTGTTPHYANSTMRNLRAGRAAFAADVGFGGGALAHLSGLANFDGPITHIKLYSFQSNNFNGGTIRAVGMK